MKHFPSCWAGVLAIVVFAGTGAANDKTPFSRRNPVVEAVQKTKAAIVAVRVPRPNGAKDMIGTGIILDERGFIVTNRHVVGTAKKVNITLNDQSEHQADVVWAEARWDLAVVQVNLNKPLPYLNLAPTDDLMVGESVIAVGHPFGYTNTVSTGIVSALGREITMPSGDVLNQLIQHDAPINPGNSGGPLLNINGELIGINVALREGARGIAFAINAGTVKSVLSQNLSALRVAGVNHGLAVKEKVLAETGDVRQRVVIAGFQGKGLEAGDEILSVAERAVTNGFDVERAMWDKKPGDHVTLKVVRSGEEMTVTLVLGAGSPGAGQVAGNFVGTPLRSANPSTENVAAGTQHR